MPLQKLELLAPAGKMEVLHSVVKAGADAVYLGGKKFNMRQLNTEFNFTNEDLKEAVDFVHQNGRKCYVTVNNLYNAKEINEIADYLVFLQEIGVDALIAQDLGIIELCTELQLKVPLHGSVQMGISNSAAVKLLEEKGFERVILSRNLSLAEIKAISEQTRLGLEHFVHGELCISHSGQCYMSSFVTGQSGNRGRCCKPCRWLYNLQGAKSSEYNGQQYLMAPKDMCLYPYLTEMIAAGVSSFKVEGRMRNADYLAYLVSTYRRAFDRLIADPEAYSLDQLEWSNLQEQRIRDYCTGDILGVMNRESIGYDGKREPLFISTAQPLASLNNMELPLTEVSPPAEIPELTVKVGDLDSFKEILSSGVNNIILGWNRFRQNRHNWSSIEIHKALDLNRSNGTKIFIETPRIVSQNVLKEIDEIKQLLDTSNVDGIIVNDLGSFSILKDSGCELWSGYGLNTFNHKAVSFLQGLGISRVTASLELKFSDVQSMLESGQHIELLVQGPLPGIISDYCVIRAAQSEHGENCAKYCMQDKYALIDSYNQEYKILTDYKCRNHVFFPYELCLFAYLPLLGSWGVKSFRVDGQYYDVNKLKAVVSLYAEAIRQQPGMQKMTADNYSRLLQLFPQGLTTIPFMSA